MSFSSIFFAWLLYILLEVLVRYNGFIRSTASHEVTCHCSDFIHDTASFQLQDRFWNLIFNPYCIIKFILLYICSPGWAITNFLKSRICNADGSSVKTARKEFIISNNTDNIIVSTLLFFGTFALHLLKFVPDIFIGFLFWRFMSRSIEITYAFGNDILNERNESGIEKNQRIQLALKSYLEIYIYSAAFYFVLSPHLASLESAMLGALYVGTLTNISFVTNCIEMKYLVFLQVFATLSLIILSIAGYLGNAKPNQ